MNYSRNSLHINFLNLSHYFDKRDSIIFDTGINAPINFHLNKLPPYTCDIYLTWNDKKLDYHLPTFIGCGYVVTGDTIKKLHNSEDETIIFGSGELDINMEEAIDNKYKENNFLLLDANYKYNNEIYRGKYVYWRLNDLDLVFNEVEDIIDYINELPYRVKYIKRFNLPPIQ